MKKIVYYSIPVLTLVVFVFVMNSGGYFKRPKGEDDNVPQYIQTVKNDLISERWESALENTEKLKTAWKKVVPRIQFSVERDEINAINAGLARLTGYIEGRDKAGGLSEIGQIDEHWKDLEK